MGYKNLEELCHKLESAMGKIRDGKLDVHSEIIDVMLKAVDAIEEMLNRIEDEDKDDFDISGIVSALQPLTGEEKEKVEIEKTTVQDVERGDADVRVDVVLSEDCIMKGVRAALVIEALGEVAEVVKTIPDENVMDSADFDGKFSVFLRGEADKIDDVMSRIAEVEKFEVIELEGKSAEKKSAEKAKVVEKKPEKIVNVDSVGINSCLRSKQLKEERKSESIRVNTSQLDTIMNLVGELVIGRSRLLQIATEYDIPELREAVTIMDKSIASLQDEIMRIRMVKIEKVFSKFPRMVRDLARKLGKKVEFVMEGLDTELDRTVLDEMSDPLVHLVRNAVDHGIEKPEERKAAGKSEIGKIRLSAWREKNNIIIEIEDDGKGLDIEKIKQKAIEKGVITPDKAESMSDDELKMLIFAPGLSTREEEANEISGRGVGMDVVKTTVERLGGSVKLISEKGRGTKMRIHLPPTVAIIKSLFVKVGNEMYAIPISSVVEALYVTAENWKVIHGNPFLFVRGKLIPAFRLRDVFNVKKGRAEREVGIIVEKEGDRYALIADTISDQQEIVIKPLSGFLSKIKGFSGVTIVGDGRVIPIIDVSSLLGGERLA